MRRMYSETELRRLIRKYAVEGLLGKDINVEGITSKGIANTGELANYGDVAISGDLDVQGEGKGKVTANELLERMSGYSFNKTGVTPTLNYVGVVKTGNKITFAISGVYTRSSADGSNLSLGVFSVPEAIANKLYPNSLGALANVDLALFNSTTEYTSLPTRMSKSADGSLPITMYHASILTEDVAYEFRLEITFLLSDNLVAEE